MLADGVRNVLRRLDMLSGEPAPPRPDMRTIGSALWLRCQHEGWWDAVVCPGDEVSEGAPLGHVRDLWGDELETIRAPRDGVILFVTTSPAVSADGLLLGLGVDLAPVASGR